MDEPTPPSNPELLRWYCLRAQPKRERVAASQLALVPDVEVFLPMVKYARHSATGKQTRVEPMFPNYLFARFDAGARHRAVRFAKGVAYILARGTRFEEVNPRIIEELRSLTVADVLELKVEPWQVGEEVRIVRGIFAQTRGSIVELRPAQERVLLLLELLGSPQLIELPIDDLQLRYQQPR